jgi:superfamily II DNA or RNA helicase
LTGREHGRTIAPGAGRVKDLDARSPACYQSLVTDKPQTILLSLVAAKLVRLNGKGLVARATDDMRVGTFNPAPGCFLGSDRFGAFREAGKAGGLRFAMEPRKGSYALTPDAAARAAAAFQAAGFEVRAADDAAATWLDGGAAQVNARIDEAEATLEAARARLGATGLTPRPYQEQGILWLGSRRSGLLLDEMGLGKTMQVLGAVPAGGRLVVVCPASVKGAWKLEVQRWRPDLTCTILSGRGSFRWPEPGEVVVLNFEILPDTKFAAFYDTAPAGERSRIGAPQGVIVVADEAHNLTSKKAARTQRFAALVQAALAAGGRAWGLTGTPIKNAPAELRVLLEVFDLFAEAFGSWTGFCRAYGGPDLVRSSKAVATPEALAGLARVSLRREKAQVAKDLPPKTYQQVPVALEGEAAAIARKVEEALRLKLMAETERLGRDLTTEEIEALITKAMRASTEIGDMAEARRVIATAKIPAALEVVRRFEDEGLPLVVATAHRDVAEAIGKREGWGCISGGDDAEERTEVIARFQAGELRGVAFTIRAGGAGVTLTAASTILFVDRDWTAAANLQAEDRIHRIGQTAPCTVMSLVGDCWIDQHVEQLVNSKARLMTSTTDVVRAAGGQVVRAPSLAEVKVGVDPRVPTGPALDAELRERLTGTANRAAALKCYSLATWLLDKFGKASHLPERVRGRPTLEAIEADEVQVTADEEARAAEQQREVAAYEGRPASGAVEEHAAWALEHLAQADADHAQERNDVGFAGSTQDGHRLARLLRATGGLSAEDWTRACAIAKYHRRQVGEAPTAEQEREVVAAETEAAS